MTPQDEMMERAKAVLKTNDRGRFTVPAVEKYPHQWLWDSCFIAIGLRHLDVNRAQQEILSLFDAQWSNGMVPQMIFTPSTGIFQPHNVWQSWRSPYAPEGYATSGITQTPVLAEAVVQIGEKLSPTERHNWYQQVWPPLLKYHEWLYAERDPYKEGLVVQIHPWETGLDNTPPWISEWQQYLMPWWMRLIAKTRLDSLISRSRSDIKQIPAEQRMTNLEVIGLSDAFLRLRRQNYDIQKILHKPYFAIADLTFNCVLIRANQHLKTIAAALREKLPDELVQSIKQTEKSLEELWDPASEQYYSRDFKSQKLLKELSIATLMPLYAGCISKDHANLLVKQLENDQVFGTAFPIPTVPLNSDWFNPECYWQGPTWVNTNWLIIDGLKRYGFKEHAAALSESTIEMINTSGFYEYFNPKNGKGLGIDNFAWTAALYLDLINS